jgi:hypothetical protein
LLVEYTAKSEDAVSRKKAMEGQLEAANLELTKLRNKVSLIQGKIEQEKLVSEEYEAKCLKLEAQLSRDSREAKLWRLANTNGDLKVKQVSLRLAAFCLDLSSKPSNIIISSKLEIEADWLPF